MVCLPGTLALWRCLMWPALYRSTKSALLQRFLPHRVLRRSLIKHKMPHLLVVILCAATTIHEDRVAHFRVEKRCWPSKLALRVRYESLRVASLKVSREGGAPWPSRIIQVADSFWKTFFHALRQRCIKYQAGRTTSKRCRWKVPILAA